MSIDNWCQQNGLTKSNYNYRLRRVREACFVNVQSQEPPFVDLTIAAKVIQIQEKSKISDLVAICHSSNNLVLRYFYSISRANKM